MTYMMNSRDVYKRQLLYVGPFIISQDNQNNTYVVLDPANNRVKGTYNQSEIKKYYE